MNEKRDDLQEIIDKALEGMAARGRRRVQYRYAQPGRILSQDGTHSIEGEDDQGVCVCSVKLF